MKRNRIVYGITAFTVVLYTGLIVGWHLYAPYADLTIQAPGADNRPEGTARKADDVLIGEFFMQYEVLDENPSLTGKWSSFRGEQTTNMIRTPEAIRTGEGEYPEVWNIETGEGHAAPVIYNGRVYLLDYNEQLSSDALRCFSLATGRELWRRWYRVPIKRNHGFSRTVPAIGDNYIITIGPEGHVMCCDPVTGDLRWTVDMQKEYQTEVPFWYTGQCPRVDNGILILAPAGEEVLLAGLDCLTGETRWTTPNTLGYKMSHSSVMPMTLAGKKTYVYIGVGGICGVSAEADDRGTLLWQTSKWQPSVVAPSPLQVSANQIFVVAGYGTGGALLQVDRSGNQWTATVTDQYKPSEGLSSEQQTPIFYNNMIISVMPKDGGANRGKLVCYSPSNLRSPVWTSAADERFGLGPYLLINNNLFVFKDDGELYVYEVGQREMKLLRKQRIMDGADAWGPLAYADGRLIVRDAHVVKCLNIVSDEE
ncbi:PQQ-binding-like beta-propeller repeat protein [Parabacteroides sp. PF5-6]|uniref:outer membrane protein assembly factor BamB family protein n=1 Tax=Parabacteroides sp. PF5-6 TaxID=1742403 RepID=UPI0024063D11|nr:PQQ-binding-like beta-propeller repeat protein [Parabacteroides sp. PF5-6]MDF9829037.1 outer membrane protein assembly factor BamB [Parabacteroides sp. PF5-6]